MIPGVTKYSPLLAQAATPHPFHDRACFHFRGKCFLPQLLLEACYQNLLFCRLETLF